MQALGDEGPVEAGERHHVADRAERDEVEPGEQVGLGPAPRTSRAGGARD